MSDLLWDVFISYASEDGESVALPLYDALKSKGLFVWLDKEQLRPGDSLRETIESALAKSRFGVVILSPKFLSKRWPKQELNGLFSLERDDRKVILPVWHGLSKNDLVSLSPIIADRFAPQTSQGMAAVAEALARVVLRPGSGSPSIQTPSIAQRLLQLLEPPSSIEKLLHFFWMNPGIMSFGTSHCDLARNENFGGVVVPLASIGRSVSYSLNEVSLYFFADVSGPYSTPAGIAPDILIAGLQATDAIRWSLGQEKSLARDLFPASEVVRRLENFGLEFRAVLVARRRGMLLDRQALFSSFVTTDEDRSVLLNGRMGGSHYPRLFVSSYDTFVDRATSVAGHV